jgi:ribosome maturation factor RimP
MQPNLNQVTTLAEQVVSSFGLSLVDVKIGQQGRNRTLEITIFKPGANISLDDCEQVSRKLEALLDEQTPPIIDGAFLLEVQSPGIDRKLSSEREFALFSGQNVEVKTKQKVEGLGSAFTGKLAGLADGRVLVDHPEKMSDRPKHKKSKQETTAEGPESVAVEMSNIISVRLIPPSPIILTIE